MPKLKFISETKLAKYLDISAEELELLRLHNYIPSSCVVVDGESYWVKAEIDGLFGLIVKNWLEAQP